MMKLSRSFLIISALLASLPMVSATRAQQMVSPKPENIVRQMCDYLKSLHQFSYRADVTYDAPDATGKNIQRTFKMETSVQRPDRLRVDAQGDDVNKQFFFDGKTITLYDKTDKVYATMEVPPDIEGALEKAHTDFNLRVALTDLTSPRLYELLAKHLPGARNVGLEKVRGSSCHHLVFDEKNVKLQLWVDAGGKPLPRKVVITEKAAPQPLQWTALLDAWKTSPKLDDSLFVFAVPSGVHRIKFLPAQTSAASGQPAAPDKTRR